ARYPTCVWRIVPVSQLPPGGLGAFLIIARAPRLFPKVFAPGPLISRQRRFVRIDVGLVGIDAHPEFRTAVRLRKEPRLESNREQNERLGSAKRQPHAKFGSVRNIWNVRIRRAHKCLSSSV